MAQGPQFFISNDSTNKFTKDERDLLKLVLRQREPSALAQVLSNVQVVTSVKIVRFIVRKGHTCHLDHFLDAIDDKSALAKYYPEIAVHILLSSLLKNVSVPQFALIERLIKDFNIDPNFVDFKNGSILHMLCHFTHGQDECCNFLSRLLDHGYAIDIDIETRKRRRTRDQFFMSTPLQYAIEKGSYKLAVFLMKHKASVDQLVFDKYSWRCNVRAKEKADYLRLIKGLVYLDVLTLESVYNSVKLTKSDRIQLNWFMASRTLVELCLRVIRKSFYSSDHGERMDAFIDQLEEQIVVDPKIRSFVNLDHL